MCICPSSKSPWNSPQPKAFVGLSWPQWIDLWSFLHSCDLTHLYSKSQWYYSREWVRLGGQTHSIHHSSFVSSNTYPHVTATNSVSKKWHVYPPTNKYEHWPQTSPPCNRCHSSGISCINHKHKLWIWQFMKCGGWLPLKSLQKLIMLYNDIKLKSTQPFNLPN